MNESVASPNAASPESILLTDSYELSMLQSYLDSAMEAPAVFEFFVRRLPFERSFLIAAGLEQALEYLTHAQFTPEEIAWLRTTGRYRENLLDYLARFRFTGDVDAIQEGTPFFPQEPILRIEAPLPQAQLVESRLINLLQFQTLVASKAARCRLAAGHKPRLVDFGMRRAHGFEAALLASRSSFIAGFDGTSNVLAEQRFGIPTFGTMAHSFVQAHLDELGAFEQFALSHPHDAVLLIDTYDIERAASSLGELARRIAPVRIRGVRIDSGDLGWHARQVREILDRQGLREVTIFASGGLDEHRVRALIDSGAPIDGFGIGTSLDTSADSPSLDCAYKLVQYAGRACYKLSQGKATLPGAKQVFRRSSVVHPAADTLALRDENLDGQALLQPVMREGQRLHGPVSLHKIRAHCLSEMKRLAPELRTIRMTPYALQEVPLSPKLRNARVNLHR